MERTSAAVSALSALVIIVAIVLGPLGLNTVQFHMNRNAIVQYQGSEVVMLAVAIGLFIAAWLWLSVPRVAASISLGLALFVVYTMITVVMGQEYERFPDGNTEKFFLLYAVATGLASVLVILSFNTLLATKLDMSSGWTTVTKWTLGMQGGIFALMWLGQIMNIYRTGMSPEVEETRLLFWLVKYLDLGFAIPAALTAVALLHFRQPLAGMLVTGVSGFITVMLVAIVAMMVSLWLHDESGGSLVVAASLTLLAIPSALVCWQWVRMAANA